MESLNVVRRYLETSLPVIIEQNKQQLKETQRLAEILKLYVEKAEEHENS